MLPDSYNIRPNVESHLYANNKNNTNYDQMIKIERKKLFVIQKNLNEIDAMWVSDCNFIPHLSPRMTRLDPRIQLAKKKNLLLKSCWLFVFIFFCCMLLRFLFIKSKRWQIYCISFIVETVICRASKNMLVFKVLLRKNQYIETRFIIISRNLTFCTYFMLFSVFTFINNTLNPLFLHKCSNLLYTF